MTATEHKTKINPDVCVRLVRAIRQLLEAGRDTVNIARTLGVQQSFGKYDGCYPSAIKAIADEECREINKNIRAENAQILTAAKASLRREFPDMSRYFV